MIPECEAAKTDSNCHPGSFAKLEAKNNSKEIRGDGRMPRSADLELGLSTRGAGGLGDGENEFSEALQTVARMLREMAESKAHAQEEVVHWKNKYEMERLQNANFEHLVAPDHTSIDYMRLDSHTNPEPDASELKAGGLPNGKARIPKTDSCQALEGICTQQLLRHNANSFSSIQSESLMDEEDSGKKALFSLVWGQAGQTNKRHKHDVVSFEAGDITMAIRSNKQIMLTWDTPPQCVFILSKPNATTVQLLCGEMVRWLRQEKGVRVYVEPAVKNELIKESQYFEFVETCETEEEVLDLHTKVDLVITLGGDGTVLWAASIFKGPMPPLVSFSMGSLGFMTQFQSDRYRESLQKLMAGPVYITLRHRLHCQIVRHAQNMRREEGAPISPPPQEEYLVLNEVSIDRGMSSSLSNLECYCDGHFVTVVQGDGLIVSTPSGSTAYSLAAGGSMVHPQVPGILFTPICPHSLSFRPLILPEYVTLRVQLPMSCRGQAWASFDGKARQQLQGGDALILHMSSWPVPAACEKESSGDFLRSVREGLHWNLRKPQLSDGPQNPDNRA